MNVLASDINAPRKRFTLGIAGFGRLARDYYVPALRKLLPAGRIAVADPLEQARNCARRLLPHVHTYADHRDLFQDEHLDALMVASPPSTHLALWYAAAAAEIPVFMEKPFLLSGELDQIDRGDPAWQRLMVNFNRIHWPPYRRMRRMVQAGAVGNPITAEFTLVVNVAAWCTVSNHRFVPEEGGLLYDLGSQALHLAYFVMAQEPLEVTAHETPGPVGTHAITLKLAYGDELKVRCHIGYGKQNREGALVCGHGGCLRLANPNFNTWHCRGFNPLGRALQTFADVATLGYRGLLRSRSMLRYSIREAIANFFKRIDDGRPYCPGFEDAFRIATWTVAAGRSLEKHKPMTLTGSGGH